MSAQKLANLIQSYDQVVKSLRDLYNDAYFKDWAVDNSLDTQSLITVAKKKLKDNFQIEYDSVAAKSKIIKEGSVVEILVNHMDGMKSGSAVVKSYSSPAMISDITMKDGMKMPNHKWLTNDEVKLK